MSQADKELCDVVLDKLSEAYKLLSPQAKQFIESELHEDDIIDLQQAILYYQEIIKDRFYSEDPDEEDYRLIDWMKIFIDCFLDHVDDI
jgi:hypothetical protein